MGGTDTESGRSATGGNKKYESVTQNAGEEE